MKEKILAQKDFEQLLLWHFDQINSRNQLVPPEVHHQHFCSLSDGSHNKTTETMPQILFPA